MCSLLAMRATFQVASKQSELGIGQTDFEYNRFKVVDFLPTMYMIELLLASKRPQEIASYDTIVIPFDKYTWFMTSCYIITQVLLLLVMQNLWSKITGTRNPTDFYFEGYS